MSHPELELHPLGVPVNRAPPASDLRPISGRPNWFTDRAGKEIYIEPPPPPGWPYNWTAPAP